MRSTLQVPKLRTQAHQVSYETTHYYVRRVFIQVSERCWSSWVDFAAAVASPCLFRRAPRSTHVEWTANCTSVKVHSHPARLRPSTDVDARLRTSTRDGRRRARCEWTFRLSVVIQQIGHRQIFRQLVLPYLQLTVFIGDELLRIACPCVYLFVCLLAYLKTSCPNFMKLSVHVITCCRDSVLLWRHCNTLCTSGSVDVMFSHNG